MNHARPARWAVPAAAVLMAAACATSKPQIAAPAPTPPPLDASYDWHVLVVVPFGSVLKDVPLTLHEVLVFRDEAPSAAHADDPECYAVNGTGPRFVARSPSLYLLCFKHGRLARVEATVPLPEKEAEQIFADACAAWTKNAQAPAAAACEGADGSIAFAARLERAPDVADPQLTIQLDAADPASDRTPDRAPDRAPDR
jgi:hypothetical protein